MESYQIQNRKGFSIFLKALLIYVSSIITSFLIAPIVGRLYDRVFGIARSGGSFLFPNLGSSLEGFVYSYAFFVSLLTTLLIVESKKLFLTWFVGVGGFILLFLFGGGLKVISYFIAVSLIGYIVGLGLRWVYRRLVSRKVSA